MFYNTLAFLSSLMLFITSMSVMPIHAQPQDWKWVKHYGLPNSHAVVFCTHIDRNNNLYLGGHIGCTTSDSVFTMDSVSLKAIGLEHLFLAKFDSNGTCLWAKTADSQYDVVHMIATDKDGNVYACGTTSSKNFTVGDTIYSNTHEGYDDIFLIKYNANGKLLWTRYGGGINFDQALSESVDSSGNVYLVGGFKSGTLSFGSTTLKNVSYQYNSFIVKYDSNGTLLWARSNGRDNTAMTITDITNDKDGNIYTLRSTNTQYHDTVFVEKYTNNYEKIWSQTLTPMLPKKICLGTDNRIYCAGVYRYNSLTVGSQVLQNKGNHNVALIAMNTDGQILWANSIGGDSVDLCNEISSDYLGNVYCSGTYNSPILTSGTKTMNNVGDFDLFITKYNPNGECIWTTTFGGNRSDLFCGVKVDTYNNLCIVGNFYSSSIMVGSNQFNSKSGTDLFIAKLGSNSTTAVQETGYFKFMNTFFYPNPSTGKLRFQEPSEGQWTITIYSLLGQKVYESPLSQSAEIDLSLQAKGIYYYRLFNTQGAVHRGSIVLE